MLKNVISDNKKILKKDLNFLYLLNRVDSVLTTPEKNFSQILYLWNLFMPWYLIPYLKKNFSNFYSYFGISMIPVTLKNTFIYLFYFKKCILIFLLL